MDSRFITADERETLFNEVWAEPVTTVAKRYGMSDNGFRKHCKRLGIPLPPSGYWARVKAGQKVSKPALPKVTGELKKYARNYAIKYRTDLEQLTDAELMADEELSLLREETKTFIRETCSRIQIKDKLRNPHHLITEHKEEVIYRKKRDKALKEASFSSSYYASVKKTAAFGTSEKRRLEDVRLLEQAASDWDKAEKIRRFTDCSKHCEAVARIERVKG